MRQQTYTAQDHAERAACKWSLDKPHKEFIVAVTMGRSHDQHWFVMSRSDYGRSSAQGVAAFRNGKRFAV